MTSLPKESPFRAFTRRYPTVVDRIFIPVKISQPDPPGEEDKFPKLDFNALLDTGASKSVIKPETAKTLGLISTGSAMIKHAGGAEVTKTYLIDLYLPNYVRFRGLVVYECSDGVGDFGAIVGMDIIARGDLSITNFENKTLVSFRIPSYKEHDYVRESIRLQFPGVKPYANCPCGAKNALGKPLKFSECHGQLLHTTK
jgi:hypothetical protein